MIKTVFFGTHKFASTILQSLIDNPDIEVALVITQPDKPIGRKQELQKSPVKILAQKYNIPIDQPNNLKTYKLPVPKHSSGSRIQNIGITSYQLQLGIVAQYGLLIPENILNLPKHGTLNVHTSLLPKYRGASPIQSALINGETETGITIMKMDKGLDTGPILLQKRLKIQPDDTYLTLDEKLAVMGLQALTEAVPDYTNGKITPKPQDNKKATECRQLSRENGKIDWTKTAEQIYNLYRGLTPWPGVWTIWNGKRLKLLKIQPACHETKFFVAKKKLKPGLVKIKDNRLFIGCGKETIEILELQLEGKKPMTANEFLNGHKNVDGVSLI